MKEVTRILDAIQQGDPKATDALLPLVYDELRRLAAQRMASETPGKTLQATATDANSDTAADLARKKGFSRIVLILSGQSAQPSKPMRE
jgi:hypothetical protein